MTAKRVCFWIRFFLVAVAVCGIYLCIFGYPFLASLSSLSSLANEYQIGAWLIFLWVVSIPCFVILILMWKISCAVKKEMVFTLAIAKRVKACSQILFIDTSFLLIGGIVFTAFRVIDIFIPIIFILSIFGFFLAFVAAVSSHYIAKAAEIKEENEGTI